MEVVAESSEHYITSIALDAAGTLFALCAASGDVLRCEMDKRRFVPVCTTEATPLGLAIDPATSEFLLANHADQNILTCPRAGGAEVTPYVSKFEGRGFIGPTALALCPRSGELFFTDGGREGDSSLANPVGAVYRTVQGRGQLVPLCAGGLQQPSAVAVGLDGCVYVCEQAANRLLRYVPRGNHYVGGVFRQFQGTMGPSGVAVHPTDGSVYVTLYEPSTVGAAYANAAGEADSDGKVVVLDRHGNDKGCIVTPGSQLRDVAVSADGATVFVLHSDEHTCSSTVYCCDV